MSRVVKKVPVGVVAVGVIAVDREGKGMPFCGIKGAL